MQEMQRPDGSSFQELFTEQQVKDGSVAKRRELLEALGYKFTKLERVDANKYMPHQGNKEVARRVKQALRDAARQATVTTV